jgi:hypothetical protein
VAWHGGARVAVGLDNQRSSRVPKGKIHVR